MEPFWKEPVCDERASIRSECRDAKVGDGCCFDSKKVVVVVVVVVVVQGYLAHNKTHPLGSSRRPMSRVPGGS